MVHQLKALFFEEVLFLFQCLCFNLQQIVNVVIYFEFPLKFVIIIFKYVVHESF